MASLRHLISGLLIGLCLLALPARTASGHEDGIRIVENFHAALIEVMKKAPDMNMEARFQRLSAEIGRSFDFSFMSRVTAGTSWKRATKAERTSLIQAFKRMSAAQYTARFDGYSGQSFKTLKASNGPRRSLIVQTELIQPSAKPIELSYVMRKRKAGWRIVDVILAGGISELALRYSESRQIVRKKGITGLAASVHASAKRMMEPD